jgi:hypothetical protein
MNREIEATVYFIKNRSFLIFIIFISCRTSVLQIGIRIPPQDRESYSGHHRKWADDKDVELILKKTKLKLN